ncbi:hypothetical protein ACI65C_006884 [Semiaphis heraclei]
MSKNLDENNIYQLLYEEIPSDDDSETSCDDSDNDADYCLPSREVVISESSSDSEYEDSEILNLDNHNIYILPSPLKKTRLSLKRKNNNKDGEIPKKIPVSRRQLFSNFNFEEGDMSGIQPLATPSSSQSSQPQINIQQNHNEINTPFIPPIWSKNNNNMHSSPLFTSLEGVTIDFFQPFYEENSTYLDEINIAHNVVNSDDERSVEKLVENNETNGSSEYVNESDEMKSSICHAISDTNKETSTSIQNILNLIKVNDTKYGSSSSGLQTLEAGLKKITSEGQWETFLHTAGSLSVPFRNRSGTKISVQPTSIARRSPNITRGSKRLPSCRPAKCESNTKKRKRNLGSNVNANLPNAKSHGRAH